MKSFLGVIFASLIVVCGLSATSFAQRSQTTTVAQSRRYHNRNINQRQENQQDRIGQGIKSGQLNPREAARLERQEAHINRVESRYRKSGNGLSPRERVRLQRDLNRESRHIHRQRHDGQTQPR